ncbi:MAG TPA: competence/damage-inducible protein A [Miltoncostaeaceae bacterium]|nr:competence/damage-inducible protein A [Miltoncostaeaceae bacterium]
MRAAILVTGDEILRGAIQERNAGILSRSLGPRGVAVDRIEMVGDGLDAIGGALQRLLAAGFDLICITGGLGPTHDDLTMEAVARVTGRRLRLSDEALAMVQARSLALSRRPDVQAAVQEKQATLPDGARVLPPPGTAPGCALVHDGTVIVVLPGPPWELAMMWEEALSHEPVAGLLARAEAPHERVLRLWAVPESQLIAEIDGFDPRAWGRLRVGICARAAELEVTVRAARGDEWAADALEERIAERLPEQLFSRDGRTIDGVVAEGLLAAGQTVAVAESCTGGMLGARLTERPGSSAYVRGGVIAYANDVKRALLEVPERILVVDGAVSAECAQAMARGVQRALRADWGVAITGVAGPGGGTAEKPVGLVYIGVAGPGDSLGHTRHDRGGDRAVIRERAVAGALHLLRRSLLAGTAVYGHR